MNVERGIRGSCRFWAACLSILAPAIGWSSPDYAGCRSCHGQFNPGIYTSRHDDTSWGTALMTAHQQWVGNECLACHLVEGPGAVRLNRSGDAVLSNGCIGCHGRQEDVNNQCTGEADDPESEVQCGAGAGLRRVHESRVGPGTCRGCHDNDPVPVGEDVLPVNFTTAATVISDSCNADGSESRFGDTGLDNDGDGLRDGDDPDCQFPINPGLNDAWFDPSTPGQGFLISVLKDTGFVFVAWFTYDVELPPADALSTLGDPGHRWLTAQGPFDGDTAALDLFVSSGGVFDSQVPAVGAPEQVGTLTIRWTDCSEATVTYDISPIGEGSMTIRRIAGDNVPLCEMLAEDPEIR